MSLAYRYSIATACGMIYEDDVQDRSPIRIDFEAVPSVRRCSIGWTSFGKDLYEEGLTFVK